MELTIPKASISRWGPFAFQGHPVAGGKIIPLIAAAQKDAIDRASQDTEALARQVRTTDVIVSTELRTLADRVERLERDNP